MESKRSRRSSRVFRFVGAVVFVAFALWFTVRSAALAQQVDAGAAIPSLSPPAASHQVEVSVDLLGVLADPGRAPR